MYEKPELVVLGAVDGVVLGFPGDNGDNAVWGAQTVETAAGLDD